MHNSHERGHLMATPVRLVVRWVPRRRAKLCKMLAQTGAGNEFAEVVNLILS